jgi:hypothetical protein
MNWLVAAAAFAVAMMLFSTITSTVTECLHRICHLREKGLRMMLVQLFEREVWPRLADRGDVKIEVARNRFIEQLTRNRAVPEWGRLSWLGHWFAPARITSLSPAELAGRLAETDYGKHLAARAGATADALVDDLSRRFERIGADASAYFQQRATTLSLLVAMAIAFTLNVDAVRLFAVLGSDQVLAQRLIEQGKEEQARRAEQSRQADPAQPAPVAAPAGGDTDDVQKIDAAVKRVRAQTAEALSSGLPIGSRYFPYCDDGGLGEGCATLRAEIAKTDASRAAYADDAFRFTLGTVLTAPRLWIRWLAFTILSGLLIGLGSPFWFKAFTRLSSMLEIGRVLGLRTRYDTEAGNVREAVVQAAPPPPATPAAAFRSALPLPVGRLVLAPGGSPLKR